MAGCSTVKKLIGKVCEKHPELVGERFASNGVCVQCRRECQKKYREKNKATIRELAAKHRSLYQQEINARHRIRYRRPEVQAGIHKYRADNSERSKSYAAVYRVKHREKHKKIVKQHYAANRGEYIMRARAREAHISQTATPVWANKFFIAEAYHLAKLREKICGGVWHVDHIVPLKSKVVCGLHVESNLCVIPGKDNMKKGNRYWPDMPV